MSKVRSYKGLAFSEEDKLGRLQLRRPFLWDMVKLDASPGTRLSKSAVTFRWGLPEEKEEVQIPARELARNHIYYDDEGQPYEAPWMMVPSIRLLPGVPFEAEIVGPLSPFKTFLVLLGYDEIP